MSGVVPPVSSERPGHAAGSSYHLVAEDLRPFLETFPGIPLSQEYLLAIRAAPAPPPLAPPAPQPEHRIIPGALDNPDLRVLILDPNPGATGRAGLLHMHGGGYVMGSPDGFLPTLQRYAMATGSVIVSVNYRLAPETEFPGALEDNFAALCWLHENADTLGVDPGRIAVAGESAGGGHAAALAIAARDRAGPPIAFQFLIYPMLDDRTGSSRNVSPFVGEYVWTAEHNRFGWSSLLGCEAGGKVPEGSVPARNPDLTGLPPAFIASGALDIFVEEDIAFASRLISSGVPVELYIEPGGFHGFNQMVPDAATSQRFNERLLDGLRRGLNG